MPRLKQFDEKEVLQKAMEVFWKKGYHATSMQDLVDGMGINRASLYDTFGDKESLFEKAFQQYRDNSKKHIADFLRQQPSTREGLAALFDQTINNALRDPDGKGCFVVNTTAELAPGDEEMCKTLIQNKTELESLFEDYIRHGIKAGDVDQSKDPKMIAAFLFTLYSGIMLLTKIEKDKNKLMTTIQAGLAVLG